MPMIFVESRDEFVKRHGGSLVKAIDSDKLWLLPDGACIVRDTFNSAEPVMYEPPADDLRRLKLRLRYHQSRLQPAERDFQALRNALTGRGYTFKWPVSRYGIANPGDGVRALRVIQAYVLAEREAIEALEQEIESLPEVQAQRKLEQRNCQIDDKLASQHEDALQEIATIEI